MAAIFQRDFIARKDNDNNLNFRQVVPFLIARIYFSVTGATMSVYPG